jgi:3-oxoacyl-[acyl-carrier-protein] synthase-3
LFGDGAAATLVQGSETLSESTLGPFVFGTDGHGAENLIVPVGGMRQRRVCIETVRDTRDDQENPRSPEHLYMNGPEIFTFTLQQVPRAVSAVLARGGKSLADVDLFIFHQANLYILQHLRKKIKIPEEKFYLALREFGNTVSATIPIALKQAASEGRLQPGNLVMLVGFGVGYSWAAALVRWAPQDQ